MSTEPMSPDRAREIGAMTFSEFRKLPWVEQREYESFPMSQEEVGRIMRDLNDKMQSDDGDTAIIQGDGGTTV